MKPTPFTEFLDRSDCILGEGAVIERLRRNTDLELDPDIVNSAFIYDDVKRAALETIYRQYLDIGFQYDLPLFLSTRPGGPVGSELRQPVMPKGT